MAFSKIDSATLNSRGATTLPNQPKISVEDLKKEFDAPAKEIVAPAFNTLVDSLNSTSASASIGMVAPTGRTGNTVQSVINKISSDLAVAESSISGSSHSHDNKEVLDDLAKTDDAHLEYLGNKIPFASETVIDSNYHHTDNNYTTTEKNKLATVEINANNYSLPIADTDTLGGVIPDGTTITVDEDGVISAVGGGGGGGAANAFKTVNVNSVSVTASGEDSFRLKGGDGISLSADATTKEITITNTGGGGGGSSTGDMLKSVYDIDNDGIVDSAATLSGLQSSIAELNFVKGVTSAIQTQINSKASKSYAYDKSTMDTKLLGKVDVVDGKGLSTNDYTNDDKTAVGTISNKVDKVNGKGLSTNDYTTEDKTAVGSLKSDYASGKVLSDNNYDSSSKAIVDGVTAKLGTWTSVVSGVTGDESVEFTGIPSGATIDPYMENASGTMPTNWVMTQIGTTVTISFDALTVGTNFKLHYWS